MNIIRFFQSLNNLEKIAFGSLLIFLLILPLLQYNQLIDLVTLPRALFLGLTVLVISLTFLFEKNNSRLSHLFALLQTPIGIGFLVLFSVFFSLSLSAQELVSVSPDSILASLCANTQIYISGSNTNFTQGSNTITLKIDGNIIYENPTPLVLDDETLVTLLDAGLFLTDVCDNFIDVEVENSVDGLLQLSDYFYVGCHQITDVDPAEAVIGQTLEVTVSGQYIDFTAGSNTIWLSQGSNTIFAFDNQVTPISETEALVEFSIPPGIACNDFYTVNGSIDCYLAQPLVESFHISCGAFLEGIVYNDENGNGTQDPGEVGLPNRQINIEPGNISVLTQGDGTYSVPVLPGAYTVEVQVPPNYTQTSVPVTYSVNPALGETADDLDFGLTGTGSVVDDYGHLTSDGFIAGFDANMWINYGNLGTIDSDGEVVLQLDPGLVFLPGTATPAPTNVNGQTIIWDYSSLQPFETATINLSVNVPVVPPNTPLVSTLEVVPDGSDADLTNNVDTLVELVLASWDPNDKGVDPPGVGPNKEVLIEGARLTYLLRFQNTGNFTAFNVWLEDTLSNFLDPSTFELIGASHDVKVQLYDRNLAFYFDDINLPDSTTNEPESHGFVKFSIEPIEGVTDQTAILNTCHIYFDFNPAVVTNTVLTTLVDELTSIRPEPIKEQQVRVYPNPMQDFTIFEVANKTPGQAVQLQIYNTMGSQVHESLETDSRFQFHKGDLPAGIYYYQVTDRKAVLGTGKMVIK